MFEAAQNPDVDALVLFAPALAITNVARLAPYISLFGRVFPKAAWLGTEPDEAVYRYESMSFSSVAETWKVIGKTQEVAQKTHQLPVFTVVSMQDTTVLTPATLDYMASNTNPLSHTLLYSQRYIAPIPNTTIVSSNLPLEGVLSLSHLGLMIPSTHPWFGRDGTYRNCSHYGDAENPLFAKCKNGERDFYGETTAENERQGVVERIAFNPFYDAMLEQIGAFIKAIN